MAATRTGIEYVNSTWNPVTGCTPISEGCKNCYARRLAEGRLRGRYGYPAELPFHPMTHSDKLRQPLYWRKPRRIFVCSMGDLFHESISVGFIDCVLAVTALAPQHTYVILTKRPGQALAQLGGNCRNRVLARYAKLGGDAEAHPIMSNAGWPLPNVWLGVTAENQATADERIPLLLQTPAAVRFVSCEPLLGPLTLPVEAMNPKGLCGETAQYQWEDGKRIDWVIVGGETGPGARLMHPHWLRAIRDQCRQAGVPFFFKRWGGRPAPGLKRLLGGVEYNEYPQLPAPEGAR